MILETERLRIKPFSLELINAAISNDRELYKKIGIISNDEWPENDLKEALEFFKSGIQENGITGFGLWIIISKECEIIGSAGYIGEPKDGVIEIGFGIIPSKQKQGFCTEAVKALIRWAKEQQGVVKIIANSNRKNEESKRVLLKCNFIQVGIDDDLITWEYKEVSS